MRTSIPFGLLAASFVFGSLAVAQVSAKEAPMKPTVTMPQARKIALAAFPGKIVKEELEKETGGSGLRYSFDIKSAAVIHELGVDALDGKVLENSVEGSKAD